MKPIAVFYHCLFYGGSPIDYLPCAIYIVREQMDDLRHSGLLEAASFMCVGVNGGRESEGWAKRVLPAKAQVVFHGTDYHNELGTIRLIEQWLPDHPGWHVLYFHAKGATHATANPLRTNWRRCMMRNLVLQWRRCVADLESGQEAVGCHWMTGEKTPPGQSIFAGNFWWAESDYMRTLPSVMIRDRIKVSGVKSIESRYESEVWLCNGPRLPKVRDYHPAWIDQCAP